jgi:hypothetical protein
MGNAYSAREHEQALADFPLLPNPHKNCSAVERERQCVQIRKRHGVRAPLDAAHLYTNATARAVEGDLGGFRV